MLRWGDLGGLGSGARRGGPPGRGPPTVSHGWLSQPSTPEGRDRQDASGAKARARLRSLEKRSAGPTAGRLIGTLVERWMDAGRARTVLPRRLVSLRSPRGVVCQTVEEQGKGISSLRRSMPSAARLNQAEQGDRMDEERRPTRSRPGSHMSERARKAYKAVLGDDKRTLSGRGRGRG